MFSPGIASILTRLVRREGFIVRDYDRGKISDYLAGFGGVATAERKHEIGVQLLSAAAAAVDASGGRLPVGMQAEYDRDVAAAREQLDEATFAAAWAEGQAMTLEQAIELALQM